jgi:cytochrome c551/c552
MTMPCGSIRYAFLILAGAAWNMAGAAPRTIALPPETAQLKASDLPGYRIATQKCATCHSADYVSYQPPGMSLSQWTAEVGKMQYVYGASLSEDDIRKIGAYLAVAYGSAVESDLPAELKAADAGPAPAMTTAATAAGATVDEANALLAANTCLACHAIDKKIVGPAYQDVAEKYRGDRQALGKLETSIRNGVSGKWGPVPMPAFAQLTPDELRTLAEFILKQ